LPSPGRYPVLSPACKLLPSEESPSVLGDGASQIGQEASSASERKALLSFPFPNALQLRPRQVARYSVICYLEIHKTRVQWLLICFGLFDERKGKERMRVGTKKVWSLVR
jgi:hypothetical protein